MTELEVLAGLAIATIGAAWFVLFAVGIFKGGWYAQVAILSIVVLYAVTPFRLVPTMCVLGIYILMFFQWMEAREDKTK